MDKLDQLLFEAAKKRTEELNLGLSWEKIQEMHKKKARRRASILRYGSMAAMLVVGLGAGLIAGRTGWLAGPTPAPQPTLNLPPQQTAAQPVATPTPAPEALATPEAMPPDIIVDPPQEEPAVVQRTPSPTKDPGDVIIDPPKTDLMDTPEIDGMIIDPPKTSGSADDDDHPGEIIVDPPKTDGPAEEWYGSTVRFSGLADSADILDYLPGWVPEGFERMDVDADGWDIVAEDGYWGRLWVQVFPFEAISSKETQNLAVGEGKPFLVLYDENETVMNCYWTVRVSEEHALYIGCDGLTYEDSLRVIKNLGK